MESANYYILTTKLPECLKAVYDRSRFDHLYRNQPDTGAFLDSVIGKPKELRPSIQFALLDRVETSDTKWCITGTYSLEDIFEDTDAGKRKNQRQYSMNLRLVSKFEAPVLFKQGTTVWEKLSTTSGKPATKFYNGGRMLLPISEAEFRAICDYSSADSVEMEATGAEGSDGVRIAVGTERQLRDYLALNLDEIEPGLQPFEQDNYVEFVADDAGRIDLLCRDKSGAIVVVELKKGRPDDTVVGQMCRYLAWAKTKWKEPIRGIIIANILTDKLKLAASYPSSINLVEYQIEYRLTPVK